MSLLLQHRARQQHPGDLLHLMAEWVVHPMAGTKLLACAAQGQGGSQDALICIRYPLPVPFALYVRRIIWAFGFVGAVDTKMCP
jgi:hypothetical protein